MSKDVEAIGLLALKVKESGGDEVTVPTSYIRFSVQQGSLQVGGFDGSTTPPPWGAEFKLSAQIHPGKYNFSNSKVRAFYNPVNDSTWSFITEDWEITLELVDFEKKFAKGSFKFTVVGGHPQKTAEVNGTFSLTE